jgi:iron(III) transport system permease protein
MLIGGGFQLLAPQAFIQLIEFFDLQLGAALSMLLVVPALAAFAIQHWISNRRSYVTVTGGGRTGRIRKLSTILKAPLLTVSLLLGGLSLLIYGSIFAGALVETWGYDWTPTLRHLGGLSNSLPQLMNSLRVSAVAGIGGGILGILLAWLVTRPQLPRRETIDFIGTLLCAVPGTVIGSGYIIAFNNEPFFWTGTFAIIMLAFAFRRLPVVLRTGVATEKQLDPSLEEASLDLGASRARTFARVSFPLLSRAFLAGVMYIFIKSMTDLSAAIFLVGGSTQVFTVRMFNVMIRGTLGQAAAMASLLIVIIVAGLAVLSRFTGKSFIEVFRI